MTGALLLGLWAAAAAQVPGYACTSCVSPACICPTSTPPGGLSAGRTPQMLVLTFDDAVTTSSYAVVQQVLTNHINPNGQPIKATFYVALDTSKYDFPSIQKLYAAGHEIAVHTLSHNYADLQTDGVDGWRREIAGCRWALSTYANIPEDQIVGFRTPALDPNDKMLQVLYERGFLYDTSFGEMAKGLSASPSSLIWPYTLDNGVGQIAPSNQLPKRPYPGLLEIPVWMTFTNFANNTGAMMDMDLNTNYTANEVLAIWQSNFLARYLGNRAPMGLYFHASTARQWLSIPSQTVWRVAVLNQFIDWALGHPDTYVVGSRDLANYMRAPVDIVAAPTSRPFMTITNGVYPTNAIRVCNFWDNQLRFCGDCPLDRPKTNNVYFARGEGFAGGGGVSVTSQTPTFAGCQLVVSNSTAEFCYDWSATLAVSGALTNWWYDGNWTQRNGTVTFRPKQYAWQLPTGWVFRTSFGLKITNAAAFAVTNFAITFYRLGPQPTPITQFQPVASNRVALQWQELAYFYDVEASTNLLAGGWTALTTRLVRTAWTADVQQTGTPAFLRLRGAFE